MKKKNFISKEEVKNLVENCRCNGYHSVIDIPMQFYTKDTESGKYILHSDTAEFQDFVKKVKEEAFYQNFEGEYDLEDIIIDFYLDMSGLWKLYWSTYDDFGGLWDSQKTIHIVRVYLPQLLKNKVEDDEEFQVFVKKMRERVALEYDVDTATVSWKLSENERGEKVIEFEAVEEE